MEWHLGRTLKRSEVVHHLDGNGLNNDISNLRLTTQAEHLKEHPRTRKFDVAVAEVLRGKGWTLKQIGQELGVSAPSVRKGLLRKGVSTKDKRHGTNKWPVEEAARLYKKGWTLKALAKKYSICAPSVKKAFSKRGITR
jgi:lambda repressor-like predicted transcriptional regulator